MPAFFFYLLRCFALIDSSALEQTREETETEKMTHLESLVELGLSSTFSTILTQCSLDLFKVNISPVWFRCFYSLLCTHFFLCTPKVMSYCFNRWPWRRCSTLQPLTSLRHGCLGEWWQTCAELQPRWDLSLQDRLFVVSVVYVSIFFNFNSIHSVILQSPSKCLCHTVVMP